jgi:hypothetical protein
MESWKYVLMAAAMILFVALGWCSGTMLMKSASAPVALPEPFPLEANATVAPPASVVLEWQDDSPFMVVGETLLPRWMYVNGLLDKARAKGWENYIPKDEFERLHREIVDNMQNMELLYQEAERRGYGVNEAAGLLRSRIVQKSYADENAFLLSLARAGMTEDQYVELWKKQAAVDRLVREGLESSVEVTGDDTKTYYDTHTEEFVVPERVRVESISMSLGGGGEQPDCGMIRDRMRILRDRSQMQPMTEAAKEYRAAGYKDLGWVFKGQLPGSQDAALFAIQDGKVSQVLDMGSELVILKRIESRPAEQLAFDRVEGEIHKMLHETRTREKLNALLETLRKSVQVRVLEAPRENDHGTSA